MLFDGNFNGIADFADLNGNQVLDFGEPHEPVRRTQLNGRFTAQVPASFDRDTDGFIDANEGRWILIGGRPTSRSGSRCECSCRLLSATSSFRRIERGGTAYDRPRSVGCRRQSASRRSFDIPSLTTSGTDPLNATIAGDGDAAKTEETAVRIYATAQPIADLFAASAPSLSTAYLSDLVFGAFADEIAAEGSSLNLSYDSVVAGLINRISNQSGLRFSDDPAAHQAVVNAASRAIAAGNQAIDQIRVTLDLDYLNRLFQVKKVMLGELSPAMRQVVQAARTPASLATEFSGSALQSKIDAATVGTILPPSLVINNAAVIEGNDGTALIELTVDLIGDHALPVSVDFASADNTATVADGDYDSVSGEFFWAAGDNTSRVIQVPDSFRHDVRSRS